MIKSTSPNKYVVKLIVLLFIQIVATILIANRDTYQIEILGDVVQSSLNHF